MRDLELEYKIAQEPVNGITPLDFRNEIKKKLNRNYIPALFYDKFGDDLLFEDSALFNTVLDIASFASQCVLRKANGLEIPEEESLLV